MTEIPEEGAQAERPERTIVHVARDSRLEGLLAQYDDLKAKAEEAGAKFDELKKAIGSELEEAYPGNSRPTKAYEIPASAYNQAIVVSYKGKDYLPAKTIRENFPDIWNTFKQRSVYMEVSVSRKGKPRGGAK